MALCIVHTYVYLRKYDKENLKIVCYLIVDRDSLLSHFILIVAAPFTHRLFFNLFFYLTLLSPLTL